MGAMVGDILDEDCTGIGDWANGDQDNALSDQRVFDGEECFRFWAADDSGAPNDYAQRNRIDLGDIPDDFTFEFDAYFNTLPDLIVTQNSARVEVANGIINYIIAFTQEGIYVHDGASWVITGDTNNYDDASWHIIRALVTGGVLETATCDIWVDGTRTVISADCSKTSGGLDGRAWLWAYTVNGEGKTTEWHMNYLKIDSGLNPPTEGSDQTMMLRGIGR